MAGWPGQVVEQDGPWNQFARVPDGFIDLPADAQIEPVDQDHESGPWEEFQPVPDGAHIDPLPSNIVDGGSEMQGGFADELPTQAASKLSPEDEAAYGKLLRTGTVADLRGFLAQRGMSTDEAQLAKYVTARDTGKPVSAEVMYALPQVAADDAAGALGRGVLDTLTFGTAGKIGAVVGGAENALSGDGSFSDGYNRVLDNNNAVTNADEREHPWMRISGQLLGGLAIPTGLEGVGLRAGSEALRAGASMQEARVAATIAVRNRATAIGGAYGAAHGAGSADNLGDAAAGAAIEGSIGAAGGLVTGAIGQALAPGRAARSAAARAAPTTEGQRVAAAAQRQGVDVLPADVAGPAVRRFTSAAAQAPISASPIINGGQRAVEQVQGVRDRYASMIGNVLNPEAAGERAAEGARSFIARTGTRAHALYRNAEAGSVGVAVTPTQANAVLARNIRELTDTPGGADGLARLQGLQDALQNGSYSVEGVRRMRTTLRDEFAGDGLRGTDIERRVNQVADAANQDVISSLNAAGRTGVARQFQVADRYWRNRIRTIDDAIAPIIGKDGDASGEAIVKNLQTAMRGNNRRFASFLGSVPNDARGDVRASLIGRIGRSTKGAQNDEGTAFSLSTFLSNWDEIGETAKAHLFGPEARAALNDLATIASGARQTATYANRSNTSGGILGNIGAILGGAALSPFAAITTLVGQYGGGRLLASPHFTRWLARAPQSVTSTPGYVAQLSKVARSEPGIANEVLALQHRLTEAFARTPQRLAAEEPGDESLGTDRNAAQQSAEDQRLSP